MSVLLETAHAAVAAFVAHRDGGQGSFHPERRAGLEHNLKEIVDRITDWPRWRTITAERVRPTGVRELQAPYAACSARRPWHPSEASRAARGRQVPGWISSPRPLPGSPEAVSGQRPDQRPGPVGAGRGQEAKELELGRLLG